MYTTWKSIEKKEGNEYNVKFRTVVTSEGRMQIEIQEAIPRGVYKV